jgi:signal transduction histidine kinase
MPPEVRDSLFTPGAISRKVGGTGLGMKIIKEAVDAHDGHISVQSQPGKGTTFEIRLPVHALPSLPGTQQIVSK